MKHCRKVKKKLCWYNRAEPKLISICSQEVEPCFGWSNCNHKFVSWECFLYIFHRRPHPWQQTRNMPPKRYKAIRTWNFIYLTVNHRLAFIAMTQYYRIELTNWNWLSERLNDLETTKRCASAEWDLDAREIAPLSHRPVRPYGQM